MKNCKACEQETAAKFEVLEGVEILVDNQDVLTSDEIVDAIKYASIGNFGLGDLMPGSKFTVELPE